MRSITGGRVSQRARVSTNEEVRYGLKERRKPTMMPATPSGPLSSIFRRQQVELCSWDWGAMFPVTVPR